VVGPWYGTAAGGKERKEEKGEKEREDGWWARGTAQPPEA